MYITSNEYNTYTGRAASEATTLRITIACKLLDTRIGNYPINEDGYKINDDFQVWNCGVLETLHESKQEAVKIWCAKMVSFLYDNNDAPPSIQADNIKLGRFSVGGKTSTSGQQTGLLPSELAYVDSILVSSGIIKRGVKIR